MSDTMLLAQIEAAQSYEALMVKGIFGEWAPRVAAAANIARGERVLDVACGTGVLAREAARRVGTEGAVTGLDRNAGMLAVARGTAPDIEWHEGVAESLPFPDGSFDVVLSQFGLMFFEDRTAAVAEALRVLVPGGRLSFAVWDTLDNAPAYAAEVALLERMAGIPAADAVRAPFSPGDSSELIDLFARAQVADVTVRTHSGTARFPNVRVMVEADLRGWLPVMGIILSEEEIAEILGEAERVLSPWVTTDGQIEFAMSAHIITGRRAAVPS